MMSNIDFEEEWSCILSKLKKILEGVHEPSFDIEEYMSLYSKVYNMCSNRFHSYSPEIYERYCEVVEDYVNKTVLPPLREKHDEYMLRELVKQWTKYKAVVRFFFRVFNYLDIYFVQRKSLLTVKEVGMSYFRDLVYQEMQSKAKDVVLALIHKEREGGEIDRELVKNVLDIYIENGESGMEKYIEDFETFMLQDTASYYHSKALSWTENISCPEYMLKAEESLIKEREIFTHYLHSSTKPKIVEIVRYELLVVYAKPLLQNEHSWFLALLRDGNVDDLSRMYRLYNSFPQCLELFLHLFKKHVTAVTDFYIKRVFNQAANTGGMQDQIVKLQVLVRIVAELHNKYIVYVTECFQNNIPFHKILKEELGIFCDRIVAGGSSRAELLATFCDNLLKKGGSDEVIEAKLDNVVKFLIYITDKDLFVEFYRKKLARRLLFERSSNEGHERCILTKLKEQFSEKLFTFKIEGMDSMVTDMALVREQQNNFQEYLATNMTANPGIDFTVTVLTAGSWPSYRICDLNLPSEMAKCVEVYKAFYETKTERRRLQWIYSLGTCHIIGKFDQKPIELIVNAYQVAVLLLFNNTERLSYNEMLEQLNLSHEDLVRLLHSLSCAKYKILIKEPTTGSISQSDIFEFNSKFTDEMQRIKIPIPPMDERRKVVEDVSRDRRYAIDAALVRIMKRRTVLAHQLLVSECVEQLSQIFKPDIKMIKKRIENLMTREFLERDSGNPGILKYLA